jgi:phospholipid/cholesterol/gamma-HCH transport system substrate-binding protein
MKQEAKVGLFVVIACMVVAYFIINTSEEDSILRFWQHKTEKHLLQVELSDASGVRKGTSVRISGVQVGTVESITLKNGKAILSMKVDKELVIHETGYASLQSKGVLGDKFVAIFPGEGAPLKEGSVLPSKVTPTLDDIMVVVHDLGESVLNITRKFEESLDDGPDGNRFTSIASNIEELSRQILEMVKENRSHVGTVTSNFSRISTDLEQQLPQILSEMKLLISDFRSVVKDEKGKLSDTMNHTAEMTRKMNDAMTSVQNITQKIDSGQGTIGKLINDNETAAKLDNILDQASSSLEEVQKYLAAADAFKINLEFDTNYLARHDALLNRFRFQIAPNENKYYQIDISSNTGDYLPATYIESTTDLYDADGNLTGREIHLEKESPDDYSFGLQFAYRLDQFVLRGGIIEETGGAGLDYLFLKDRLKFSMEMFDFNREHDLTTHGRFDFTFRLPKGLRLIAGWDDFLESDYQSVYIGAGIRWQDDDLKPLLASFSKAL